MPKIVDHEERRKEILKKSFGFFAKKGYASATMRNLSDELGISTGTLYHYFRNKDALFAQMFEQISQEDVTLASAQIGTKDTLEEKLTALFDFLIENEQYFHNVFLMALDFYRQQPEDKKSDVLQHVVAHYRKGLREQLGVEIAGLDQVMFSLMSGLIFQRLMDPKKTSLSVHFHFVRMLADLLKKAD